MPQQDSDVRLVISGNMGELREKVQALQDEFGLEDEETETSASGEDGSLKEALRERVGRKAARFETVNDYLQQAYETTKTLTKEFPEGKSRSYIMKEAGLDDDLETDDMQALLSVLSLAGLVERNKRKWRSA